MTPDEKAKQLYETMYYKTPNILVERAKDMTAKSCAIICCDEIIAAGPMPVDQHSGRGYWKEVKKHIQSL